MMYLFHASVLRTFLRMYVEVGLCVWAYLNLEQPALKATALLAAYHLGALSRTLLERCRGQPLPIIAEGMAPIGLLVAGSGYAVTSLVTAAFGLTLVGFFVRPSLFVVPSADDKPARPTKILAKLIAMMAAALMVASLTAYFAIALTVALLYLWQSVVTRPRGDISPQTDWKPIDLTNLFHQAGYFAFCFAFWALATPTTPLMIALFFPLGWIAYWAMEFRLTATPIFRGTLLGVGHLAFAAALLAMAGATDAPSIILLTWFLTGLFGGTCYTMEHAPGGPPSGLSDDIGALLGSVAGTLAIVATDNAVAAVLVGAVFACIAGFSAIRLTHASQPGRLRTWQ
jgi:hypothetical protein